MEMDIEVSDAAVAELAKAGLGPVYRARPLERAIQQQLENPLSKSILEGKPRSPLGEGTGRGVRGEDRNRGPLSREGVVSSSQPAKRRPKWPSPVTSTPS